MDFTEAVRSALRNYGNFEGRARRSEFWFFMLFCLLAQMVASIVDEAMLFGAGRGPAGGIVTLLLLLPAIAVAARRLHDGGRSGAWLLTWLLPLVGWLIVLIWLLKHGEAGPNRWGADPRARPPGGRAPPWSDPRPLRSGPRRPWPSQSGAPSDRAGH